MEQPLPPNGSCLLGSINVAKFVFDPFTSLAAFDFDKFKRTVRIFTRMLDNVVEMNGLPLEAQREEILSKRRHGMGFTGLGSTFSLLGIRYGSPESIQLTTEIMKILAVEGYKTGVELAKEKGPAPILADASNRQKWVDGEYMRRIWAEWPEGYNEALEHGCRFTHHSSIAPTGTISLSVNNNCCIAKGAIIPTSQGDVAIENVTTDNWVQCFDSASGEFMLKPIRFVGLTRANAQVLTVTLASGKVLSATPDHKFMVKQDGQTSFKMLETIVETGIEHYTVVTVDGDETIGSISAAPSTIDTYDIEVVASADADHNFVANGMVVHNSNGIEPSFSHKYTRNVIVAGKKSKDAVDVYSYEMLLYKHITGNDTVPDTFSTSDTVSTREHVDVQAAAQYYCDSSISKTINVPTDTPFEQFKDVYMYAYDKELKGCTTFRYNAEAFQGVLVKESDLKATNYTFNLEDGTSVTVSGDTTVEYDGELHSAANLFDAIKEGVYGKY